MLEGGGPIPVRVVFFFQFFFFCFFFYEWATGNLGEGSAQQVHLLNIL